MANPKGGGAGGAGGRSHTKSKGNRYGPGRPQKKVRGTKKKRENLKMVEGPERTGSENKGGEVNCLEKGCFTSISREARGLALKMAQSEDGGPGLRDVTGAKVMRRNEP